MGRGHRPLTPPSAEPRLPVPSLVVLVGPSGSGKSTWAGERFRHNEIVSSDALRAMVGIDEQDRRAGTAAFDLLDTIVATRLERELTTVVDSLGYDRPRRLRWIAEARRRGIAAHVVMFDTAAAVCEERNGARARPIPKAALAGQVSRLAAVREELADDGFDEIHVVRTDPAPAVAPEPSPRLEHRPAAGERMPFGLLLSRFDWPGDASVRADQLAAVATRAESAGFTDLWVMDHFRQIPQVGRPWEEIPESYTTLAYLAAVTTDVRLGTLVSGITFRNPAHLGRIVATLDVLSGGRAMCGLGLAWHEDEHRGYGWDFPPADVRYELLEDTVRMLPLLWGKGSPPFRGKRFSAEELMCYPRPIQERIPILIGGSGRKRTLRLVAEHADMCNLFGPPDRIRSLVATLHDHCAAVGRDPSAITVTNLTTALVATDRRSLNARVDEIRPRGVGGDQYARRMNAGTVPEQVERFEAFAAAGVQHPIVVLPDVHLEGSIERFGEVMASLRSP